ncbi:MAG: hypothetical protein ACI9MC_001969 [Kiritimatiellia bacterium]
MRERLSVDDPNAALRLLVPHLASPSDDTRANLYQLFADIAETLWRQPVASRARDAAASDNPDVQYPLAHLLIDTGRPDLAALFLTDAGRRFPTDRALELLGRHAEVVQLLDETPAPKGLLVRALHAHNAAPLGDISRAREATTSLNAGEDVRARHLLARLGRAVARADYLNMNDVYRSFSSNTRGLWLSAPERDDWHSVAEGVARLSAVLDARNLAPPAVLAGPGDASAGYAAVIAQALGGVQVKPWFGEPQAGLVVAFELSSLGPELRSTLRARVPHQLLHVHSADRGSEHGVRPDFIAVRASDSVEPWAEEEDGPFGGGDEPPEDDEWSDEVDWRMSVDLPAWVRSWSSAPTSALPSALSDFPRERLWVGA